METNRIPFTTFLHTAFDRGDYSTDDSIAFVLPLFREVLGFHEAGLVGPFERENVLFLTDHFLDIDETVAHAPVPALYRVEALFPRTRSRSFEVVDTIRLRTDTGNDTMHSESLQVHTHLREPLLHPAYLPGYRSFEQLVGHHDPQTDIFCLGLILGGMAMGLDLHDEEDLRVFVHRRINPSMHYPRIHPTLGRLITDMTELDRSRRCQDLYDVILRLEHYRDYDAEKQTDLSQIAGWVHKEPTARESFILNKLRNRLFDTSRRNRLLYYKPNMRFVNLTVSSVPVVLHYQSIRPDLLFTWQGELAEKITGMKEIVLNKYLRFEDHVYLPASLDRVRVESQRDIQEYGFSQLKLVIAFLNWHNLKEDPKERIQSPLLLLPVSLKKNKKLKEDHYVLKVLDNAAEVNPVLAGQLKELYGIRLPDRINLDEMSPEQFYEHVKAQIEEANQGVVLHYIDKPRIRLIHSEARQTVNNYRKRLRRMPGQEGGYQSIPYSYDREHYKPLGLEIFRQRIKPGTSFLEFITDTGVSVVRRDLADSGGRGLSGHDELGEGAGRGRGDGGGQRGEGAGVREKDIYALAQSEDNPYSWDFDVCHIVLGNFNYKKMSLVRDYNVVIDEQLQHHVFDALFSEQPRHFPEFNFEGNKPDDWYHVVTADPTQTRAILQSRAGYNYIIQGPPGTGKSQTITNLIADFVARGKNILFVCEKRAALDVVYHRLKQVGLEELCCYIHDSQGDKREFIKNLKSTYEDFIGNKLDLAQLKASRQQLLDKINVQLDLIREFHSTSLSEGKDSGIGVRQLIEDLILLREELVPIEAKEEEALPAYPDWQAAGAVLRELDGILNETGADPIFALHPFSRIQENILLSPAPHQALDQALGQALAALDETEHLLGACGVDPRHVQDMERLKNLVQFAVLLYPFAQTGFLSLADPDREEAKELARRFRHYRQQQDLYQQALKKNEHWTQKVPQTDIDTAIALAAKYENTFSGRFTGSWKRLKKQVQNSYDLSQHAVKPSVQHLLEQLKAEYLAAADMKQTKRQLEQDYQMDNPETARLAIDLLQNKKGNAELDYLLSQADAAVLVKTLQALQQPLNRLEIQLKRCLQEIPDGNLSVLRDELQNIQANADGLREWLPFLRSFAGLSPAVKNALRRLPLRVVQMGAAIAWKSLRELYQTHRVFANTDRQALDKAVQQLGDGYNALLELNANIIRAYVRQRFLQQLDLSGRAASQLNEEQKKFKKAYTEGRKILENEFGKSMRYKSIRELSEKESGLVLKDIKPVWLMSPYSVSDSLPLDSTHFDVVIFDEASQITLEEGVPALYRSQQTIIVGDEKQMPPTDFFSTGIKDNDPDDMDKPEDREENEWLNDDADSLLVQGSRKLGSTLLSWHYRSHYETLISYSNHAFYEGDLLTIPDKTIHHQEKAPIRVTGAEDALTGVHCLFDRSISFHHLPESIYDKRSNSGEADYIAGLIRELLRRDTRESIGIVAFSQQQQSAIETALDSLAEKDAVFAQQLEEAYNRTENDQFTGLIIKNLENIQGDERDIIIMSVCYGPDSRRRMLMNFGPVNKKGGEKRLNVLFSRARKHMAVVSSIRYEQITNEYNEGANYLRRFLQYAELISLGRMTAARGILDSLVPHKAEEQGAIQPTVVRAQLKEQLKALGYEVAEQVGQSDFKCSLAVKREKEDEAYSLAILIDDEVHYRNSNLVEQYYQRPAILKAFGWTVLSVYAKDWLHQPQKVMEAVVKALSAPVSPAGASGAGVAGQGGEGARGDGQGVAGQSGSGLAGQSGQGSGLSVQGGQGQALKPLGIDGGEAKAGSGPGPYDHLVFQRLELHEPGVDKFWEFAITGNKLVTRWGRIGTRGQTLVKTFPDEEAAGKEKERQEKEQLMKGFKPA
jgi:predicted DNA-binding WGR domain protein/DNA polymerase III delta prime subunit